jgi:alpha-D-xyloside xylohydrolase
MRMLPKTFAAGLALTFLASTSAFALDGAFEKTADGVIVTPASGPARKVRLQVMGERIIHVTATPTDSFDAPESLMVTAKPQTGGFTVTQAGGKLVLKTAKATAEVSLADGTVDFKDARARWSWPSATAAPSSR